MKHSRIRSLGSLVLLSTLATCGEPPPPAPAPASWHEDVVYQVFPRSFQDGDGDGTGDLKGIIQRVPYLHDLGVNVLWLNPIFPSGQVDSGYDVSDLTGIDPKFGTLNDFQQLADAVHSHGMKLMLDLVLNHTSDQHPWFTADVARKTLQRKLADLLARADTVEGEAIVSLLVDPGSAAEARGPHVAAAKAALAAYMAHDDKAAEQAGYPDHAESARRLAEHLEPCVGRGANCAALTMPFDDFYIWRAKANNWTSLFSGSAWRSVPDVGGFCMHIFSVHQVDLNWRNPQVRQGMAAAAAVWQSRGVDGFRLDSIATLAKDPRFLADPVARETGIRGLPFFTNLPPVHRYLQDFAHNLAPDTRTVGEAAFNRIDAPLQFAGSDRHELNEVFVFDQVSLDADHAKWRKLPVDMVQLKKIFVDQQKMIHGRAWLGNYLENHDQLRIVSRFGDAARYPTESAQTFATLLMTLEGSPFIYQGQELGMTDLPPKTFSTIDQIEDVEGRNWYHETVKQGENPNATFEKVASRARDNVRSAVQWSAAPNAGFTTGKSQVRINPNYTTINAAAEANDAGSVLSTYKRLIAVRRQRPDWVTGTFEDIAPTHPKVFCYRRTLGHDSSWVLLNLSSQPQDIYLPLSTLPVSATTVLYSNAKQTPVLSHHIKLAPWQATVYGTQGGEGAGARSPAPHR